MKIPIFWTTRVHILCGAPICFPERVANALTGFQLRSACGGKCNLLLKRVSLPKALFILRKAQCSMNIFIQRGRASAAWLIFIYFTLLFCNNCLIDSFPEAIAITLHASLSFIAYALLRVSFNTVVSRIV